jgi:hypothetical protein
MNIEKLKEPEHILQMTRKCKLWDSKNRVLLYIQSHENLIILKREVPAKG